MLRSQSINLAPLPDVVSVQCEAKQIGWNKSRLGSVDSDNADQNAVETRDQPSFPAFPPYEDSGTNGQNTGNIVQSKHVSIFPSTKDDCSERWIRDRLEIIDISVILAVTLQLKDHNDALLIAIQLQLQAMPIDI